MAARGSSFTLMALLMLNILALAQSNLKRKNLKNVLFISIDDLRPELGTYGHNTIKSPNIDALAAKSIVFERAYCQVAVCSPSRASMLTGRRPDTNHVWKIADDEYWRYYTNATTIPQYFKENGYVSIGMGKIFHHGQSGGFDDKQYSWSLPYYHSPLQQANYTSSWWSFEGYEDHQLPDGEIADRAICALKELKLNRTKGIDTPFFLAVGFHKPHLPFHAPKKYYDLYPTAEQVALPENPNVPLDFPPIARGFGDITYYNDIRPYYYTANCSTDVDASFHECRIPDDHARKLRRGYYACISYIDTLVGKMVRELEDLDMADDTIIVLWSDHGWHLGEHNHWAKQTNFEDAIRVPLVIRVPGKTDKGIRTNALVELIDIFPSITELAGLKVPPLCPVQNNNLLTCVEGTTVTPLIQSPNRPWKKAAFSQFPRPWTGMTAIPDKPPFSGDEHQEDVMGYSIRVDNFHFIEWYSFDRITAKPDWTDIWGTELYQHIVHHEPFNNENFNLAFEPEMQDIVKELRQMLHDGWRAAQP